MGTDWLYLMVSFDNDVDSIPRGTMSNYTGLLLNCMNREWTEIINSVAKVHPGLYLFPL